jgi:hypothetical protein
METQVSDRMNKPARVAAVGAGLALALVATLAAATTYKWVDEKGVTHYTDKMPPEAVNKSNVQLNREGVPVKKTAPAVTPEQARAREVEVEQARETSRQEQEQGRKDRALLDSYTTESDIDLAKSRSLRIIENTLQSAEVNRGRLVKRRDELVASKQALAGKPVPPNLERDLANVDAELARQNEFIMRKKQELVTIAARYDADKLRWQAIRSGAVKVPEPAPKSVAESPAKK